MNVSFNSLIPSENVSILAKELQNISGELVLKREDLLHPAISGNKFRKLKYNLQEAFILKRDTIVTFGGAFSNHIAAVAAAGKMTGLATVGYIRGEELENSYTYNATLKYAAEHGMTLRFISREQYRHKDSEQFLEEISAQFPNAYILPEGGTNTLAVKGCEEILTPADSGFDYICTAVGTGGTLAGLIMASENTQHVIGYSALKGTFQKKVIATHTSKTNFTLKDTYCFGGYAKIDSELIRFMNNFKQETGILLDPVYTAKMLFGIFADLKNGEIPENSRILAIHTGGIQGISGMNELLKKRNLPQIET